MKKICLDVGANAGQECKLALDGGYTVYAFEPILQLQQIMQNRFKNHPEFHPVPLAVDIKNGWTRFYENNTGACSSIYPFADDLKGRWDRNDFVVVNSYPVMTIRLDTFMEIYGIDDVHYLWIDAQGNDFNVLKSLGDKLELVREGRVEGALRTNLYTNDDNNLEDIANWMRQRGYIVNVVPHDHGNEGDAFFTRIRV